MDGEEEVIIKEQAEFDIFCNRLKTRENIYAEAIFKHCGDNEWLIYSFEHNILKRDFVIFPYSSPFYSIGSIMRNLKSKILQPLTNLCFDRYVPQITSESWENAILAQKFNDHLQFNNGFSEADETTLGIYRAKEA